MGTVRMDAAAVLAIADQVLDGADRLDEIHWPTITSASLMGSSVGAAAASSGPADRLADIVVHLRAWASAVRASASAIEQADRLGGPR
ncbi:hypothetical protein [Mycolicibacterium sp.]|uniref:hypothetical protein n=1 Tax=Mycolicibacterium sp. TaxID=2320850 RepID=UPI001A267CD0|nr:hypothetical protein [Mycolicibacterium sp.]MBJ7341344.1 hypothetical protein [Mycolicibacterium sp.]